MKHLLFMLLALLVAGPALADEAKFQDLLFTSQAWRDAGNLDSALEASQQAVKLEPGSAYAKINLTRMLAAKGNLEQALTLLNDVLAAEPANILALLWRGHLEVALARWDQAEADYLKVLDQDHNRAWAQAGLAAIALERVQDRQALEHLVQAQTLAGEDPALHFLIGGIYQRLGLLTNARQELERSLELNPRQVRVLIDTGEVYQRLGLTGLALDAWRQALSLNPKDLGALSHLLAVLAWRADQALSQGKIDQAIQDWQAMLKYDPGNGQALLHLRARTQ